MKYNIELLNQMANVSEDTLAYQYISYLKKGGGIHIKKKNRGSFTRWCGGNVTEECIRKGKNSSNPKIRKKATFAANARKWKHQEGGIIRPSFEEWYPTVPKDKNDTIRYNLRRAYELAPQEDLDKFVKDKNFHLNTFYWNENGIGEFVKRYDHPTIQYELDAYFNKPNFNSKYFLDTSGEYYRYIPNKKTLPIKKKVNNSINSPR